MKTRRVFLQGFPMLAAFSGHLAWYTTASAQASRQRAIRLDGLCYSYYREITNERIARVLAAGLTVAVLDLNAVPRRYDTALRALHQWQKKFKAPASRVRAIRQAADVQHAQQAH